MEIGVIISCYNSNLGVEENNTLKKMVTKQKYNTVTL